MDANVILQQMLILVLIMAAGFIIRKMKIINEETNEHITKLLLKLTLPATLIASVLGGTLEIDRAQTPIFFLIVALSFAITWVISGVFAWVCIKNKDERGAYTSMGMFGNVNLMGLPFVETFLGREYMVFGIIYSMVFTLLMFSLGMKHIGGNEAKVSAKLIFSPVMCAGMLSILIFLLDVHMPYVVESSLSRLGAVTSPAAMIILGSTLAGMKFKEMFKGWEVYAISTLRVIVAPIVLFYLLLPITSEPFLLKTILIMNAIPMAISIVIITAHYQKHQEIVGKGIFVSHVLSIITLPILLAWMFGAIPVGEAVSENDDYYSGVESYYEYVLPAEAWNEIAEEE
jgi:hypothetical protein